MKIKGILTLVVLLVTTGISAQDYVDWNRAERLSEDSLESLIKDKRLYPNWVNDTHTLYYSVREADGALHHYLVNAATGERTDMIKNCDSFVSQYAAITGDTLNPADIRLYGHRFEAGDLTHFYLKKKGKPMVYDISSGTLRLTDETTAEPQRGKPIGMLRDDSEDSLFTVLGCGYDLYIKDNRTGHIRRITTDGKEDASYTYRCSQDTVPNNTKGFWVGHKYVCLVQDMSCVKEMGLINSLASPRPKVVTFKMPMPGDTGVRQYKLFFYDADKGEGKLAPIGKYADQVVDMNYFRSADALFFTRRSRKADRIDLCRLNLADGSVTELITEECKPHLNLSLFNYRILDNGRHFLWWSERTGRGNYYLYDRNGRLLNRVTRGESLVAGSVIYVDTVRRSMIFAAYGGEKGINPYYTLYYRVNLDGKKQTLLTPADGTHELKLSADCRFATDIYSRVDMPPVMEVLSVDDPKHRYKIAETDISALKHAGWQPPTVLTVKAADGTTDLCGVMYLPTNLDKTKKYPIISNVYPGPQDDQIPRSFVLDDNGNQSLAELGFVVINMPSRGSSPLRGRDFYTYGYGNLRDYPLQDDKHTIEQLARQYSFIDTTRVGIYGHSGGAMQTVAAMLTYPDFYKVAVAASGNHDNNIYIQWWGETFHGIEEKLDPKTGKTTFSAHIPTNMELADRLKGRLLLITGDVDKNVPPSSTYRMADALIKANKRFDMFVMPGKDHGVMCPYYQNLIRYYFVEHLLHSEKLHTDIINHK